VSCSELQRVAMCRATEETAHVRVLNCVAVCCRVLQCVTACCSVLQCVAVYQTTEEQTHLRVAVCCSVV